MTILNDSQLAILNGDMQTNPGVTDMVAAEDDIGLAEYYNIATQNEGWITEYTLGTLFEAIDWQETISRSDAERDMLQFMYSFGYVNMSRLNIRQGMGDIYSGSDPRTVAQREALIAAAKRLINRVETLLVEEESQGAYVLGFEGDISYIDAAAARTL